MKTESAAKSSWEASYVARKKQLLANAHDLGPVSVTVVPRKHKAFAVSVIEEPVKPERRKQPAKGTKHT